MTSCAASDEKFVNMTSFRFWYFVLLPIAKIKQISTHALTVSFHSEQKILKTVSSSTPCSVGVREQLPPLGLLLTRKYTKAEPFRLSAEMKQSGVKVNIYDTGEESFSYLSFVLSYSIRIALTLSYMLCFHSQSCNTLWGLIGHFEWHLLVQIGDVMALCKTAVTPLLMHWSCCGLALSHWNALSVSHRKEMSSFSMIQGFKDSKIVYSMTIHSFYWYMVAI